MSESTQFIMFYLSIFMVMMLSDALASVASETKYNVFGSMFFSLMWPIFIPIIIASAVIKTRNFKGDL